MAGTTQTNERYLLPAGTRPSDISQPEPKPVVAERSVVLTVQLLVRQEFETAGDKEAREIAKGYVSETIEAEAPEIRVVMFLDEQVTSRREEAY